MNDARGRSGKRLEIRTRETFREGRAAAVHLAVWCARQALDVPLERCIACSDCTLTELPSGNGDGFVVCIGSDDDDRAARQPQLGFAAQGSGAGDRITVAAIMVTRVVCVAPDLGLRTLERLFVDEGVDAMPVVDDRGFPLGIASKSDLVRWHDRRPLPADRSTYIVADIMKTCPHCVPASTSIARAAAFMAFENVQALPVVSALGDVIGIVTAADVLAWFARSYGYVLGNARP